MRCRRGGLERFGIQTLSSSAFAHFKFHLVGRISASPPPVLRAVHAGTKTDGGDPS
jgi:hypothetical protein